MPSAFFAFKLDNSPIPPLNTAHYSAHLPEKLRTRGAYAKARRHEALAAHLTGEVFNSNTYRSITASLCFSFLFSMQLAIITP